MGDLELLERLQHELVEMIKLRKWCTDYYGKYGTKARIHRLRLEIGKLMLKIERGCVGSGPDTWDM